MTTAAQPTAAVLLVDDDADLRAEMARYLAGQGYAVHEAANAAAARALLDAEPIEVVVLDVNMPGEDGLSLCRGISGRNGPPILMLSAMGEAVDRILGLELGADDYVVKPIPPRELLARVKALLRRRPSAPTAKRRSVYNFANFRLDLPARQLKAPSGLMLMLTRTELTILTALLDSPQAAVSRESLLKLMRGDDADSAGRSIDLHISRLRRKIHAQTDREIIRTHRGAGYLLDAQVSAE